MEGKQPLPSRNLCEVKEKLVVKKTGISYNKFVPKQKKKGMIL